MKAQATLLTSLLLLAGCARDTGPDEAMQAFAAFQHALQQRDVERRLSEGNRGSR